MKAFWLSLSMLTVFPIPVALYDGIEKPAKSSLFFPFAGLVIGCCCGLAAWLLQPLLPPWPLAVICTALMAAVSGGFHLDGLADSADGFFSSRPPEKMLEIMKDSRIGVMGVLALLFVLFLKITLLEQLATERMNFSLLILFAALHGRCALCYHMVFLPPVQKKGLGQSFWNRSKINLILPLALSSSAFSFFPWPTALSLVGSTLLIAAFWSFYCHRKIAGGSGDTLGAVNELAEVTVLLAAVAVS